MQKPQQGTYPAYYEPYLALIQSDDILLGLEEQLLKTRSLLTEIPIEKESYRYAEGKWSVKEVVGHMIDTERIMAYRVLAISRGEKQSLPGFNEDEYVANSNFDGRTMLSLIDEYTSMRKANLVFYKTLTNEMLQRVGTANGRDITPQALIGLTLGHELHHVNVLKERYLGV
ncbi:MAG: DinB family protein [Bacteroidia bacterium]